MKVHNAKISPLNVADESRGTQAQRAPSDAAADDVHLSELVRSLRALAANSPDRQERLEQIARACANGTYKIDAEATAGKIVDDALQY